ncbi:MAG: M48 family metalloprotease [Candidatus Eisenbacteria bacterium]|nr:M48 family metalloprotease [Candidatus Eisenbacteria bacterium]
MSRRWLWSLALPLAAAVVIAAGCAVNPVTGRREISLVSTSQELKIGEEGYKAVLEEYGRYDDPALQAYVEGVGQKVAKASHLPDLAWHFTVLDDPTVNAFAMPGGYIYVTRGILAHLNSEAQLAGVLGHEIGHVTHRHTAERITQQQLFGLGLGLASAFSESFRRYGGVAEQALGLLFLKYSRTDESEADELGVAYATRAGYDPREVPATYAMLKRVSDKAGQRLPGFLSTHPDPGDREVRTAQLARAAVAGKSGLIVSHDGYVQRLDDVVYGADPRQGYFLADQYYHPTMGFQMAFPAGWKRQDTRSAVLAAGPEDAAAMQLSLAKAEAQSPGAFVAQLSARGTFAATEGGSESVGGYAGWVGRVQVARQGQPPATLAAAFIRQAEGRMFQLLGRSKQRGDADEAKIFASVRSFRPLTDPARIAVKPDRVRVAKLTTAGRFDTAIARLGATAADLEDNTILNDVESGETLPAGALVKYIVEARPR